MPPPRTYRYDEIGAGIPKPVPSLTLGITYEPADPAKADAEVSKVVRAFPDVSRASAQFDLSVAVTIEGSRR